ncbi:MAG: excinuclease ABC subunit UvrA [Planctomycetota bacterium]|nr:excinuclease ABC subunit UvrA [Planctomycetota bacterium]
MANLFVHNARQNNLAGFDIELRKGAMTVVTGVSGSGKSSLAFDTIYAEGYRRYMDSLSIQARAFMEQLPRPDAGEITGLSPAVAISQRLTRPSPRVTVASVTEIHAYLRLLFAHEGIPYCPGCGRALETFSRAQMVRFVLTLPERTRVMVMAPLVRGRKGVHSDILRAYAREGFVRLRIDGEFKDASSLPSLDPDREHDIEGVIDRIVVRDGIRERLAESIETALRLGSGLLMLHIQKDKDSEPEIKYLGARPVCPTCDIVFPQLRPNLFSPNSSHGLCVYCDGLGEQGRIPVERVITSSDKGLLDGAIGPLNGRDGRPKPRYEAALKRFLRLFGISEDAPVGSFSSDAKDALLYGVAAEGDATSPFEGIVPFIRSRDRANVKHVECEQCNGSGLRSEALQVKLNDKNIAQLTAMEASDALEFFERLDVKVREIADVVRQVIGRLNYLCEVGLPYLELDRKARTLSGGELQRIRLATQIGSGLSGVIYVLDEPTIGLHPRDTQRLLDALGGFLENGNTVIAVEHDRAVIESADDLVELGPGAGHHGGKLVFQGSVEQMRESGTSLTGAYLRHEKEVRREETDSASSSPLDSASEKASRFNLAGFDVEIPTGTLICIAALGAGQIHPRYRGVVDRLRAAVIEGSEDEGVHGHEFLGYVELVDPAPLKRIRRSNVCTYLGFAKEIRKVYAAMPEAKIKGYSASRFSRNVGGGAVSKAVRAPVPESWRWFSCPMHTFHATTAMERVSTAKCWRFDTRASTTPTCWTWS